jgi:hypothetical protein
MHPLDPNYDHDYDEPIIFSSQLSHMREHMEAVLDLLYGEGSIDLGMLENSLEEVVHGLGMNIPKSEIMVDRRYFYHPEYVKVI